jgi:hypothetical protein
MARIRSKNINPTGSFNITGSLNVVGTTTLTQTNISGSALIVSGTMNIVQTLIDAEIVKAKLAIQGLGAFGDTGSFNVIDLGGFF